MESTLHKELLLNFFVKWFDRSHIKRSFICKSWAHFHLQRRLSIFINLSVYSLLSLLALGVPPFSFQDFLPTLHKVRFMIRWKSIIVYSYFPEDLNWAINLALMDIWEKLYFAAWCYYLLSSLLSTLQMQTYFHMCYLSSF